MAEESMSGKIVAVCVGKGGVPKHAVDAATVTAEGLSGDRHRQEFHGGPDRAVCILSIEDYATLRRDGVDATEPGTFGENLLTQGIDFDELRAGDRLQVGDEVVLEIFDVREPCATLKKIDARMPNLILGRSGFMCRVERGGRVAPGDSVATLSSVRP